MQEYQLVLLLSAVLNETEKEKMEEKIENLIKETGEISNKENSNKIRLSYPVKKETEAFLVAYHLQAEAKGIINLQNKLQEEKNILRWLLVKEEAKNKEQKTNHKKAKGMRGVEIQTESKESREESKDKEEKTKKPKKEKSETSIDEELERVLNE